jgi:hypothetical protein
VLQAGIAIEPVEGVRARRQAQAQEGPEGQDERSGEQTEAHCADEG